MSKSTYPNWINIYHEEIERGNILVSKKMHQQIERVKYMQENYKYDAKKVQMKIEFTENLCCHYKGKMARQPFKLSLYQKYIRAVMFGFVDEDGNRITKEVMILMARKNGKTTDMASLALSCLMFDFEDAPEIYSVATKKDQAKFLYNDAYNMVQMSKDLNKEITKRRTDLECNFNKGKLEPLANDSNSLDGLNIHVAIFDELHAYKDQNIIDVVQSSQGAREQPLMIFISTNGTTRGKVFDNRYEYYSKILNGDIIDYSVQPFIFEQDNLEEINDPETWEKSNPNIGVSISMKYLIDQLKKANDDPVQKTGVLTKNFNFPQNETSAFFEEEECRVNPYNEDVLYNSSGVMGLDMAYTTDITVLTYLTWNDKGEEYIKQWFFMADGVTDKNSKTDNVRYREYEDQGVVIVDGERTSQLGILEHIKQVVQEYNIKILKIGVDPYRADVILETLREEYYKEFAIAVNNSYTRANTPIIYEMKQMLKLKQIYFNSKLTSLHLAGTMADIKKDDSINLVKLNRNNRIDGTVSLLYAKKAKQLFLIE